MLIILLKVTFIFKQEQFHPFVCFSLMLDISPLSSLIRSLINRGCVCHNCWFGIAYKHRFRDHCKRQQSTFNKFFISSPLFLFSSFPFFTFLTILLTSIPLFFLFPLYGLFYVRYPHFCLSLSLSGERSLTLVSVVRKLWSFWILYRPETKGSTKSAIGTYNLRFISKAA